MAGKDGISGIGDFFKQSIYEAPGIHGEMTRKTLKRNPISKSAMKKGGVLEEPKKREERHAKEDAVTAKREARQRIKPIPDPEAQNKAGRRTASRKRSSRKGRASTILSASDDKLGG